ncbi:MAG: GNAT family N-acetyltransferase [Candidatus Hermodarchaeota archaeon]
MIRDYQTSDFPDLLEISKHIWKGEDYLPGRINEYVRDPNSHPMVVLENGKVVSIANLRFLSSDIVWLEAIRSHPDVRGKGYGTQLTQAMLEKAKSLGAEEAWLLSNVENIAAQRIIEKLSFNEMGHINMWPDWEIMSASLKQLNVTNSHISKNAQGKDDLSALNLKKGETPYNQLVNSLPLSSKAKQLSKSWKQCQSMEEITAVTSNISKGGFANLVVGEFIIYPANSQIVERKVKEGSIYYLKDPPALMTLQKSGEIERGTGVGLNTNSLLALEAALDYVNETWPNLIYWLFYPNSLNHPNIKPGFHLQRVMRKSLI